MLPNFDIDQLPVLMDFTGEELALFRPEKTGYSLWAILPFNVILEPNCIDSDIENQISEKHIKDSFESDIRLIGFHRLMRIISGEETLMDIIWRTFLAANQNALIG